VVVWACWSGRGRGEVGDPHYSLSHCNLWLAPPRPQRARSAERGARRASRQWQTAKGHGARIRARGESLVMFEFGALGGVASGRPADVHWPTWGMSRTRNLSWIVNPFSSPLMKFPKHKTCPRSLADSPVVEPHSLPALPSRQSCGRTSLPHCVEATHQHSSPRA
jgi:hypothetical protein